MQDRIIAAIAAYLEKNTEHIWHSQCERMAFSKPCEYPIFSEQSFLRARATEIAAAIAPLVEASEPEISREKYNKSFLDWLDKYFYQEKSTGFRSNTTGVFFTVKELEERYERANLDKARL